MRSPTVDVIIAARNEAAMLTRCLDALRIQDYPAERLRVVVVDDHSTDDTAAIARGAGAIVLAATSRGASAARNVGIRASSSELVGVLDAHAIPAPNWTRRLAAAFDDPRVGGCQARLISRATDPRVDRYIRAAPRYGNDHLVDQTIGGRRSLYPWMLSGNSMYRRRALDDAGGFHEAIVTCEDVDLAWRVVLCGYLLMYADDTYAVHYEGLGWWRFVRKGWNYGRGAARVSQRYGPHGARNSFAPNVAIGGPIEETLSGLQYWAGYSIERLRGPRGLGLCDVAPVRRFREPFGWTPGVTLRIADEAVYWLRGTQETVIVQLRRRQRIVLDRVGNFVWRRVADRLTRAEIVHALVHAYGIAQRTAEVDLDEMIQELIELGMVARD
jgi:glycosyltransferase involved in cell wall biosynthesis